VYAGSGGRCDGATNGCAEGDFEEEEEAGDVMDERDGRLWLLILLSSLLPVPISSFLSPMDFMGASSASRGPPKPTAVSRVWLYEGGGYNGSLNCRFSWSNVPIKGSGSDSACFRDSVG
jgi:hypothetical protein